MAEKKKKNPRMTTVRGLLKYPRLIVPDTNYKKEGEYNTKVLFEPDRADVQGMLKKLDEITDKAWQTIREDADNKKHLKAMVKVLPYRNETDKEGEETGKLEMNFSMPAKVTAQKGPRKGETFKFFPALFDAFGNPIKNTKELRIGGGTEAKVTFEYWPYFASNDKKVGITRRLVAVQIIKLVEWTSQGSAEDYGFGSEDDGEFDSTSTAANTGADAGDDDEDEDEGGATDDESGSDF